jgi:hypothetical protein
MYYLAADPSNLMFINNLKVCKGVFHSPSFLRAIDENLKNAVSMYEAVHTDRKKEAVFEKVRAEHYSYCPSRMGAIYLFQDIDTALKANEKWWSNKRHIYSTRIREGSIVLIADSQWLNCTELDYENNAHMYFQESKTDNPLIELVIMGTIEVSPEPEMLSH